MTAATAPVSRTILESQFEGAIATSRDPFKPTEFGESLMWHLVKLVCMTAPEGPLGVRAYEELESGDLDEIVRDLRKTIVRHVHKAIQAPQ